MQYGRYEIIRELGKGAMGIVYLAKDPVIGRLVALKTLRSGVFVDEDDVKEFQERFRREAQAAGILTHPNIVGVYDIGAGEDGSSFIAMEYAEGLNLKEILVQGRPIGFQDLALVMAQVAEALDFAHERGIVHRDVKPANIIIRDKNKAKITDFGIAKIASSVSSLTMTGQFLGTPNYMAPEQVRGSEVDGRADIFSLGICLYEALTKEKPFGGDSLTTISYKIVHESFTPPSKVDGRIPKDFDTVVERCLAKDPADRYQRAVHVAADLRAIAAGRPVAAQIPAVDDESFSQAETLLSDDQGSIPTVESRLPTTEQKLVDSDTGSTSRRGRATLNEIVPPQLKEEVPSSLFWSIVGGIIGAVVLTAVAISAQRAEVPPIDREREELVGKQVQLKQEGEELLAAGNVEGAYEKYFELRQLAPNSPEVGSRLRTLETIRATRMSYEQRLSEARLELARGKELFDEGEYSEAVPFFENAFALDPELSAAVNYLQMTREKIEEQEARARRAAAQAAPPRPAAASAGSTGTDSPEQKSTATLLTVMDSQVRDGYMTVAVDGETLVHEELWSESWGFLKRRSPRDVNVYSQIPLGARQVEVWIVIDRQQVRQREVIDLPDLTAGKIYRLRVEFDPERKALNLDIS